MQREHSKSLPSIKAKEIALSARNISESASDASIEIGEKRKFLVLKEMHELSLSQ